MTYETITLRELRDALENIRTEIACLKSVLNTQEAAALLHVSNARVDELRRSGELPAVKSGRGYIFRRKDLETYVYKRTQEVA